MNYVLQEKIEQWYNCVFTLFDKDLSISFQNYNLLFKEWRLESLEKKKVYASDGGGLFIIVVKLQFTNVSYVVAT